MNKQIIHNFISFILSETKECPLSFKQENALLKIADKYISKVEAQEKEENNSAKIHFYNLLERLKKYTEVRYGINWTDEYYMALAYEWKDNVSGLEIRVAELEAKL